MYIALAALLLAALMATTASAQTSSPPATPNVHREDIEWLDVWITDGAGTNLPRVLLIGDSITRAYYPAVEKRLAGKASVSRVASSKSVGDPALLTELAGVLQEYHWDVIHFNNGMHGLDYTEDDYKRAYPSFVATIKKYAPNAKLICATTTPVYVGPALTALSPRTDRVILRNRIAESVAKDQNIPVDDLFAILNGHPEYYSPDGVHSNEAGIAAESAQVAAGIESLLSAKP